MKQSGAQGGESPDGRRRRCRQPPHGPPLPLVLALVFVPGFSAAATVDVWSRPERRPPVRTYDVRHYRIALRLEDETRSFRGETEVTLAPLRDGLRTVRLDAETFTVTAVRDATGKGLPFVQKEGRLDVDPSRTAGPGEAIVLDVRYEARTVHV